MVLSLLWIGLSMNSCRCCWGLSWMYLLYSEGISIWIHIIWIYLVVFIVHLSVKSILRHAHLWLHVWSNSRIKRSMGFFKLSLLNTLERLWWNLSNHHFISLILAYFVHITDHNGRRYNDTTMWISEANNLAERWKLKCIRKSIQKFLNTHHFGNVNWHLVLSKSCLELKVHFIFLKLNFFWNYKHTGSYTKNIISR